MSAVTQNEYTGNGSTTNYSFTFPYLKASDIKCSLDAVATTAFTLANATTIQFNTAPANGVKIKIFRETSIDNLTATFYAGSAIKSEDLNDNFTQNLYVTQEVNGRYISALGGTMTGNFNLGEDADITFEGATANDHETTITVADPTQANTITFPNVTGNVVTTGDTGTVATGMIANDAVTMDKLNSGVLPTDITVASANLVDGTIVNADVNSSAAIAGTKVAPDFGSQNVVTTGTATTGALTVTGAIAVSTTVDGRDIAADGTKLDGIETAATADQTAAEIRTLVESATDSNVFTDADHTKLNGIDTGATDDQTASEIKTLIASSPLDSSHLAANSVTTSEIADAELTTLAGMQSGTASKLADSTALTADIADLNQIDGLTKQTTLSDSDASFPTSGAVVDYVAAQLAPLGGFEVVANEQSFPNTQPASGVVISIADAGGLVVSATGTASGQTVGGTTVNITGIASNFNSSTVDAGIRFLVASTGSGQNYTYHKATLKEDDLISLSGDINDFSERYRVGSSNPTSSLHSGDLFFNTGTGKLLVYNGTNSAWEEAQSIGNFFISTLSPAFDGSTQDFTLTNAPTNAQQVLLIINGVVQKPNAGTSTPSEGFALSGSTVKLGAAPATGSTYHAVVMGSTVNIGTPSNNTVTSAILQNGSVITAKIADDAVDTDKLANSINTAIAANTAKTTNATHTGDVTGSTSLTIANDAVTTAKIANEAVTLAKLPHGDGSSDGKFLRANNGADPTFESLPSSGVTVSNNANNRVVTGDGTNLNAESSLVFDGTKLGVGTTSPQEILHVKAASETVSSRDGVILGTTDSLAADTGLPLLWASNIGTDADYPVASVCGRKENATSDEAGGYLQFATCASPGSLQERMRINSSGQVGIGVTPSDLLHLKFGTNLHMRFNNGVDSLPTINSQQDAGAYNGLGIRADNIRFQTGQSPAERMRIGSDGKLFVNCTAAFSGLTNGKMYVETASGVPALVLKHTNDNDGNTIEMQHQRAGANSGAYTGFQMSFRNNAGTQVGTITSTVNATAYNTSSDYRLKENVNLITNGITKVKNLIPKRFNFIADPSKKVIDGFLAHEVATVVPEAVTGEKDAMRSDSEIAVQQLDTSKLIPVLTAALQEAVGKIETLEAKVAVLEAA